jgi:hypothetical protein
MAYAETELDPDEWAEQLFKGPVTQAMVAQALRAAEYRAERREREACARIADDVAGKVPPNDARHIDWQSGYQDGAMEVAAAIRERSKS